MDIHQTNCPKRHKGALGGLRGSNIQKSREAVKRLDRLAPTLVHVGGFIWEYKYKSPLNTPGGMVGGGGRGHKFKSLGKLSNGWTDWHQIWYTSVDSSGNGHRLKTIRPTIPRGNILGGFMGSTSFWEMWSNGRNDWEYILHMQNADDSGNGHRVNKLAPKTQWGAF